MLSVSKLERLYNLNFDEVGHLLYVVGHLLYEVGRLLYEVGRLLYEVGHLLYEVGHLLGLGTRLFSDVYMV